MNPFCTLFPQSFISTKFIFISILVVLLSTHPCQSNDSHSRNNETDREALLAFKSQISSDPFRFLTSWNDSVHFCNWSGVECDRRWQRVVTLSIKNLMLSGSISPYIGNMSFLRNLSLANNSFSHEIPPQLGRLHMLETLNLENNSFSGDIPANLSACTNLNRMFISGNNLHGKIPAEIGSLGKLERLAIANNHLIGEIPQSFGNLTSLVQLSVANNDLVGSIPRVLGQLKNLKRLIFYLNHFSNVIPITIFNISSLQLLDFSDNQMNGSLPLDMGMSLPNLESFNVANNSLIGSIPTSISNLSNLVSLDVPFNQLTGNMPTFDKLSKLVHLSVSFNSLGSGQASDLSFISSLSNATDLEALSLSGNNFGGTLPESLGNLSTKLSGLYLGANQISGKLPPGIGNLVNLEMLDVQQNHFTGNIPSDFWKLQNLRYLNLGLNKFSGNISSFVGNLSFLLQLYLNGNDFEGEIPPSVGNCKQLLSLDLSRNKLNGTIPQELFGLSSLSSILDLSYNRLTGPLPIEISNLKNLGILNISRNILSGEIPTSIGRCASMEYLYMGGNFFQGNIPSSLSALRSIRELDFSSNNLLGPIPNLLGSLDLRYLNLSFNDFEGELPSEGIFKNPSAFFVNGNNKLCGGIPELKLSRCNVKGPQKRRSTLTRRIILIPTVLGLLGLTLAFGVLLCCWLKKNKKKEPLSSSVEYSSLVRISYQSLVKATNGFISSNLIGMGGYGSVYRGVLDDGNAIAVKVLDLQRRGALRSFVAECEALSNIRHQNLVSVLSVCSGIDYQGNDFKAMVYELIVNGSLDDWLHSVSTPMDGEPRLILNLHQRLNIAIDVSSALDYLHNQGHTPIVHCDIKPNNVLLDSEMTAHVGDFGLARLIVEDTNSLNTNQSSSLAIKGTVGYAPPEYGMGSEVSVYGDIYSYGILVLEMMIGKRPTDDVFHGSLNIHNYAKLAFPDRVMEIVDPTILFPPGADLESGDATSNHQPSICSTHENVEECLISVLRIGIGCSMEEPGERMEMSRVVTQLQIVRNSFLKA